MIALFAGSFNPIHWGHLALARYAHERLGAREVWLMLSPLNPQKEASEQWPYAERARLVRAAIAPYPYMRLVELEQALPRPLYTWRTVQALRLLYPREDFALVIGSDNLQRFRSWSRWQYLLSLIRLYVYPRPGYEIEPSEYTDIPHTLCTDAPLMDISSTEIRRGGGQYAVVSG